MLNQLTGIGIAVILIGVVLVAISATRSRSNDSDSTIGGVTQRLAYARKAPNRPIGGPLRITLDNLTVDPTGVDFDQLLQAWRWLVGPEYHAVVITALGDLFLLDEDDKAYWLDTGWGKLTEIAGSPEELQSMIVDPRSAEEWFMPQLIGDLKLSGKDLKAGECYSYIIPPSLSGVYSVDNLEPISLESHFSILGQMNEQVKDMPPGTRIDDLQILED